MASVIESLKQARELYVKMSEAAGKLQQTAMATEQDYKRLQGEIHQAASAVERLRSGALEAQREIKATFSRHFWLLLFVSCIGGLVGAMAIHLFPR